MARNMLPGSGEDCTCGEHRKRCKFGRYHTWTMGFIPEAIETWFGVDLALAQRGIAFCNDCNSVHTPTEEWPAEVA